MQKHLLENLLQYVDFSEEEIALLLSKLNTRIFKKNSFFLKEGEVCKHMAFINTGLMRAYYLKDGKEYIVSFVEEGNWVNEHSSFLTKTPSLFFIEALEDTEVLLLGYDDLQDLFCQYKSFERFGRLIAECQNYEISKRNNSLLLETPQERYQNFVKEKGKYINVLPLKYIASYVGIEPESLSRIRNRLYGPRINRLT